METVLDYLNCPYEVCADLLIVDDIAIRTINRDSRGIDDATDVLSFPMNPFSAPGDFSPLADDPDAFDPDTGELLLGDIVISMDHVQRQAEEFGHSPLREFAFLIVHSALHLTGFDHMKEEDRIAMEDAQKNVMQILGISR